MKRFRKIGEIVASIVLVLFWFQAIVGNGLIGGIKEVMPITFLTGVVFSAYMLLAKHPLTLIGMIMVLGGSYLWFIWSGLVPGLIWQDLIPDVIGIAICFVLTDWLFKKYKIKDSPSQGGRIFAWAFFSWLSISIVDWARPHAMPMVPERFPIITDNPWPESVRVGLSLSGGGYRAAIFHSGVLSALDELGVHINVLSTVSGGSIAGAYYALGGIPEDFPHAVAHGKFSLKRELLRFPNNLLVALPLSVPLSNIKLVPYLDFSRLNVQAQLLRRVFKNGAFDDEAPRLVINASDLNYGFHVAFTNDGLLLRAPDDTPMFFSDEHFEAEKRFDIASQVAISGGFPGAFPPTEYDIRVNPSTSTGTGFRTLSLVDGGVIDNLGAATLAMLNSSINGHKGRGVVDQSLVSDIVLVSDAGAIFGVNDNLTSIGAAIRSFDVAHQQRPQQEDRLLRSKMQLEFAARDHFLDARMQFMLDDDGRIEDDIANSKGHIKPQIDTLRLPLEILSKLAAEMPESSRKVALATLPLMEQAKLYFENADGQTKDHFIFLQRYGDKNQCSAQALSRGLNESNTILFCAPAVLRQSLTEGLGYYLDVFESTSTLKDYFDDDDALALHRLGRAMVFVKFARLQRIMREASESSTKNSTVR